jgi:acyl-homoserine-lactone acylase
VAIGFNKDVAWTHTVSTGQRFTLYELELRADDPLMYRYNTGWRRLTRRAVQLPVREDDGTVRVESRTVYLSHYGPVIVSEQLPWTATKAYAIRDVNLDNDQSAATYDQLNRARTIDEVEAAISLQGVAFANTIAADRAGTSYYADISAVPYVTSARLALCRVMPPRVPTSITVLNGSDPSCEWVEHPTARVRGAMPASAMPRIRRDDVVSNANDSHWLTTPAAPLEGFSPLIGAEGTARSLRTRAGLVFIDEALRGGARATPQMLEEMLLSHRNFGAELLLDDLLSVCGAPIEPVVLSAVSVDIAPSCAALRGWNRRETIDARGAQLWREFWRQATRIPGLYRTPFDVADPVHTPRGLATEQPAVREGVRRALAVAQRRLEEFKVPLDAPLGEVQYEMRGGERIAIPGGDGFTGMWSVITTELKSGGYSPIVHGNSYIQIVGWTSQGELDARGILTYSQSDNPASPHSGDQTRLYSAGKMIRLPFTEREIASDPALRTVRLRE